jgi:hypothetical protein
MGGTQSYPFLLHPVELAAPDEPLVGAEAVHRRLRTWLVDLGHDSYREQAAAISPTSNDVPLPERA